MTLRRDISFVFTKVEAMVNVADGVRVSVAGSFVEKASLVKQVVNKLVGT